jgi:hypothetical protein
MKNYLVVLAILLAMILVLPVYAATNVPPSVGFNYFPLTGTAPVEIGFDGDSLGGSTGYISGWAWNFGDGGTAYVPQPAHFFNKPGEYNVTLTVFNEWGSATAFHVIHISSPDPAPTPKSVTGIGIFRPATGFWYLDLNVDGIYDKAIKFGQKGDTPFTGDWDGDGYAGIGIFRPSTGFWYLDNNLDGVADTQFRYGGALDIPVTGRFK